MNREQAIKAVADKIGLSGPFTDNLVDALAAVGVLKLEEPVAAVECSHSDGSRTGGVLVRLDVMIEALRAAGYEVRRK